MLRLGFRGSILQPSMQVYYDATCDEILSKINESMCKIKDLNKQKLLFNFLMNSSKIFTGVVDCLAKENPFNNESVNFLIVQYILSTETVKSIVDNVLSEEENEKKMASINMLRYIGKLRALMLLTYGIYQDILEESHVSHLPKLKHLTFVHFLNDGISSLSKEINKISLLL